MTGHGSCRREQFNVIFKNRSEIFYEQTFSGPEPHSTIDSVTALQPAAPSSHLLMLLRIVEGTAWNSGHRIDNNKIDTFSNRQKLSLTFIFNF